MHTELIHPLIQHKLALMRDKTTGVKLFRELTGEITRLLAFGALRDLPTREVEVATPLATAKCRVLEGEIVLVPILRAGLGMLDAMADVVSGAHVAFLGMFRDHDTTTPVEYYTNIPPATPNSTAVVLDPMLATGGSASAAVSVLKRKGFERIVFVCIIACPEGIAKFEGEHPDVPVFTAVIDDKLNDKKYIMPGLGDAGDRLFGT